jgi:hypothetical protein
MFNLFKTQKKAAPAPPKIEWRELYTQCLDNIRYLKSHVNVLNGNIEYLKAVSLRTGRAKIARLTETRNWMLRKLAEEEADLEYFGRKLAPIFKNQV